MGTRALDDDDRLAEILSEWLERLDRGEVVDPEDVVREHPELEGRLRARFLAAAAIDEVFASERPPMPERLGAFRVLEHLGAGGMGTVYLARVEGDAPALSRGDHVALKVIHPHLLARPGFFRRFLREAELGRKVRHENVVTTYGADAAIENGEQVNFLVMEYVTGRTLADFLTELGTVPEALLREIALQLANGLGAIHAAGVVHRDLKPENTLITADHVVRISDLGIARAVEDSAALTREGEFAGSLPYAAPEQFKGATPGPAGDLYSLGVLLYELATGTNPFRLEEPAAVLHAHLDSTPRPASELNHGISGFLSAVIAQLIEKEPGDRFPSVDALVEVLTEAEHSAWWAERRTSLGDPSRVLPHVPVRRETQLHGRAQDLELLGREWERARRGEGAVLLLDGEAGIGKTRLVDTFISQVNGKEARVLYGSYSPTGASSGVGDGIVQHLDSGSLETSLAPFLEPMAGLAPRFAQFLRHEGKGGIGTPALHSCYCRLLTAFSADRPLLWVVDDLHFASPDELSVIVSMARAVPGNRVLLLLTSRPGLREDTLAHLSRVPVFRRSQLRRLGAREVIELLREAFRSAGLAEKLGGKIAYKSDGIPFFVFEMIRGLKEGQFVTQLPDGTWVETKVVEQIEVPSAVKDLVEARLRDLSRDERAALDVGAVQGYSFEADLTARVLERPRIAVLQDLAAVERRSGIVVSGASGHRFDHHQIHEVLYGDLPAELRTEYHACLARAFEQRAVESDTGASKGALAHALAYHWLRGGSPRNAVQHADAAVDHLNAAFEGEALVDLVERLLDGVPDIDPELALELLMGELDALDRIGTEEQRRAVLERAEDVVRRVDSDKWPVRLAFVRSMQLRSLGRYREALDAAARGVRLCDDCACRETRVHARLELANAQFASGEFEQSLVTAQRALTEARAAGLRRFEGMILGTIGLDHRSLGRRTEALEALEQFLDIATECGHEVGVANASLNVAHLLAELGRTTEARKLYERALHATRSTGSRIDEIISAGHLAALLADVGEHDAALHHYEAATALAAQIGARGFEELWEAQRVRLLLRMGRLGEAAASPLAVVGPRNEESRGVALLLALGELRLALGDAVGAGAALAEAQRISAGETGIGDEIEIELLQGVLDEIDGALEGAEVHLRRAQGLCVRTDDVRWLARVDVALGRVTCARGDRGAATRLLESALEKALALELRSVALEAATHLAAASGDASRLLGMLAAGGELDTPAEMHARFVAWRLSGDPTQLASAGQLLDRVLASAPRDARDAVAGNVALHRAIATARAEHGGAA